MSDYGRRFCLLGSYVEEVQPCAVDIYDNLTLVWSRLWDVNRKGYLRRMGEFLDNESTHYGCQLVASDGAMHQTIYFRPAGYDT